MCNFMMHLIAGERSFDDVVLCHKRNFLVSVFVGKFHPIPSVAGERGVHLYHGGKKQVPVFNFCSTKLPYGHRSGTSLGHTLLHGGYSV